MAKNQEIIEKIRAIDTDTDADPSPELVAALDLIIKAANAGDIHRVLNEKKGVLGITDVISPLIDIDQVDFEYAGAGANPSENSAVALQTLALEKRLMIGIHKAAALPADELKGGLDELWNICTAKTPVEMYESTDTLRMGNIRNNREDGESIVTKEVWARVRGEAVKQFLLKSTALAAELGNSEDDAENQAMNLMTIIAQNEVIFKVWSNDDTNKAGIGDGEVATIIALGEQANQAIDNALGRIKTKTSVQDEITKLADTANPIDPNEPDAKAKAAQLYEIFKRVSDGLDDAHRQEFKATLESAQTVKCAHEIRESLENFDRLFTPPRDATDYPPIDTTRVEDINSAIESIENDLAEARKLLAAAKKVQEDAGPIQPYIYGGESAFKDMIVIKQKLIDEEQKKLDDYKAVAMVNKAIKALWDKVQGVATTISVDSDQIPFSSRATPQKHNEALVILQELEAEKQRIEHLTGALSKQQWAGCPSTEKLWGLVQVNVDWVLSHSRLVTLHLAIINDRSSPIIAKANFDTLPALDVLRTQQADLIENLAFIKDALAKADGLTPKIGANPIIKPRRAAAADQIKAVELILNENKIHSLCLQYQEDLENIQGEMSSTHEKDSVKKAQSQQKWNDRITELRTKFEEQKGALLDEREGLTGTRRWGDTIQKSLVTTSKLRDAVQTAVGAYYIPPPATSTWVTLQGQLSLFETTRATRGDQWKLATSPRDEEASSEIEAQPDFVKVVLQKTQIAANDVVRSVAKLDGVDVKIELDPHARTAANRTGPDYQKLSSESKQLLALQQANMLVANCPDLSKFSIFIRCKDRNDPSEANRLYAALLALGVPDKQIKSAISLDRAGMMTRDSTIVNKHLGAVAHKAVQMREDLSLLRMGLKGKTPEAKAVQKDDEVTLVRLNSDDGFKKPDPASPKP